MVLPEYAAALMVLRALNAPLLKGTEGAIVRGVRFATINVRLPALEPASFAIGKGAAVHAVRNALLLI